MTTFSFWFFWVPCILMGIGLAIDVAIATLSRFHDKDLSFWSWTAPITIAHIVLAAFGYYLFWFAAELLPWLLPILGIMGFTLVMLFIYEILTEALGGESRFSISHFICCSFGIQPESSQRFIVIVAVSWDALLSGPAMAAQATAAAWTKTEVLFSFIVAGVVVALIAEGALWLATRFRNNNFHDVESLAKLTYRGTFLELSVIGGFGLLSLWYGLTKAGNLYVAIVVSSALLTLFFLKNHNRIMSEKRREAALIINE